MKPVTLTNLEISSLCNLACAYCPASQVSDHRPATLMDDSVFHAAMGWLEIFVRNKTQQEINLFGVGEPTLHPRLAEYAAQVRRIHPQGHIQVNTNGIVLAQDPGLAADLKAAGVTEIHITDHDAATTLAALGSCSLAGITGVINRDFVTGPNNWAGQVDWVPQVQYRLLCRWLIRGEIFVLADGGVANCCIDAFGQSVRFNVIEHTPDQVDLVPFSLCEGCHHDRI